MTQCTNCKGLGWITYFDSYGERQYPDCAVCDGTGKVKLVEAGGCAPLDTSQLGPIKVDVSADAARARIVREALRSLRDHARAFEILAVEASDEALAKLGRLLK